MKKQLPAWLALAIIALAAGLLLGLTNELTAKRIEEQTLIAANAARQEVLPVAQAFAEKPVEEGAPVDNCFAGEANGELVGYTAQITVQGYGGKIEVIVGVGMDSNLTGIHVGGASFSETPGLGAKTKDPEFTEQYRGKAVPVALNKKGGVDAVTSATISSSAVNAGVNAAAEYLIAQYSLAAG
ncbi:RnfABCDGE type electron transport complex subunit G [Christensenellaceae bacterium OttesenSCG-928-L17]|nr:RnfABCDGE type electron transport complex subunit G [Christensenellaceae bacterium OttesenSCG-928-L17]